MKLKSTLLATTGVLAGALSALSFATPAEAQSATATSSVGDIIVTARKREENLQNTPIAITALNAAQIDSRGLGNLSQIAASTPSLSFAPAPQTGNPGSASVFMRGVGQLDFTMFTDPGVGVYIDGVYLARSLGSSLDFTDIARVEVLRGPQGTLFGRNTIGGAINVISAKPTDTFGGYASATTGSDSRVQLRGSVNIPISDTLLTKFSGYMLKRDGYVTHVVTGQDYGDDNALGGRAQFLWKPSENFDAELTLDGTTRDEHGNALVMYAASGFGYNGPAGVPNAAAVPNPPSQFNARLGGICTTNPNSSINCWGAAQVTGDPYKTRDTLEGPTTLDIFGTNLTMNWSVSDALNIKSITSYRTTAGGAFRDTDHSPYNYLFLKFHDRQNQYSQEFQFTGSTLEDRFHWLAGAYYFHEAGNEEYDNFNALAFDATARIRIENSNYAAFTENTFDIMPWLHLTGGLRYTHEEKQFSINYPVDVDFNPAAPPAVGQLVVGDSSVQSQTFERTTPRVTVSADVNKQTMTYLTYSEGFKSGGFNGRYTAPVPGVIPFKPEFVKMTEAGVKYQNDYLRLNAAVYQTKYSDIQVNYRPNPLQVLTVIGNAARAEINGAEVEFTLVPTKAFRIEGSLGVIDANYTQVDPGLIPAGVNLTTPFVNTPHTSGSIGASYAFDLADMGTLTPRIDYSTRTKVSLDNTDSVLARQAGVSLVNANITWENKGGDWQAVLGGTNLTDEQYLVTAAFSAGAGLAEGIYARPREWYLSLRKSF